MYDFASDPSQLDVSTQRRLVLQAAKECGDLAIKAVEREQPTLRELNSQMWTFICLSLAFSFTVVVPLLLIPLTVWPIYRTKLMVAQKWRIYLANPDSDCVHRVLIRDVRRAMSTLPRTARKLKREVGRELRSIQRTLNELRTRQDRVEDSLQSAQIPVMDSLEKQIETEADSMLRNTLQSQLDSLRAQEAAQKQLTIWRSRLAAVEGSCVASLRELISRISLVTASGGTVTDTTFEETTESLRRINTELNAAQSAAEEVMLIGRRSG